MWTVVSAASAFGLKREEPPATLGPVRVWPGQVWGLAGVDGALAWQLGLGPCGLQQAATVGCLLGGLGQHCLQREQGMKG